MLRCRFMTFASTRSPPLALMPALPMQLPNIRTTLLGEQQRPHIGAGHGARAGHHRQSRRTTSSTAQGELDALQYGGVLKPRGIVGLRGAGFTYDGVYYVKSVSHSISKGQYKQRFSLAREGVGSAHPGGAAMSRYFGKYRGKVENNADRTISGGCRSPCRRRSVRPKSGRCRARLTLARASVFSRCRRRAPMSGSSSKAATRISPSGAVASGGCWSLDFRRAPPDKKFVKTDTATLTLSDLPGRRRHDRDDQSARRSRSTCRGSRSAMATWSVKFTEQGVSINDSALEVT